MDREQAAENVINYVGELISQPARYKLVLIVGQDETARSAVVDEVTRRAAYPVLDVGVELSKELMLMPEARRPLKASSVFKALVGKCPQSTAVVVDNIGFLFDTSLQLSPLDLMEDVSRAMPLVVSWPGAVTFHDDGTIRTLSHANPDNDEYRIYSHVQTVAIVNLDAEGAQ